MPVFGAESAVSGRKDPNAKKDPTVLKKGSGL